MTQHSKFLSHLVDLIEYAERHKLKEAALALGAAAEVIAPILQAGQKDADQAKATTRVVHLSAYVSKRTKP